MAIVLGKGETMESQHKVSTRYGSGLLHVTSQALIVEIKKKGTIFYHQHKEMAGIEATGRRKIKLMWPEDTNLFDFEFTVRGANKIVEAIKKNHPYKNNFAQEGITRVIYTDKKRSEIRREREEWGFKKLKKAEKKLGKKLDVELAADVESWRWFLLHNHGAFCVRSTRVPPEIEDRFCWNDSWFAESSWPIKSYYYTLNDYWINGKSEKAPVRGGGVDRETGAYRIPAEHVRFFHGYPYVKGSAFEDPIYEKGFFVPTMVDAALDDKIMYLRWRARDLHKNGGEWPEGLYAILGYLGEYSEAVSHRVGLGNLVEKEEKYLHRRGFVSDNLVPPQRLKKLAGMQPIPEEVERRLQADEALL